MDGYRKSRNGTITETGDEQEVMLIEGGRRI